LINTINQQKKMQATK